MHIAGHYWMNTIDSGECKTYSSFTRVQESFFMHYPGLCSEILKNILLSKWRILFSSNFVNTLVTASFVVLILGKLGFIVLLQENNALKPMKSKYYKYASV